MIDDDTFQTTHRGVEENDDEINIREIFEKFKYYWKWYLLSLLLTASLAFFYLSKTLKQYQVSTTIFIADKESGGLASELSAFEDIGILSTGSNKSIITETGVLKSKSLMQKVIKDLKLNIAYFVEDKLIMNELYGENVPIIANFHIKDSILYNISETFSILPKSETTFTLKDGEGNLIKEAVFGEKVATVIGEISIMNLNTSKVKTFDEIIVRLRPIRNVAKLYNAKLSINPESKTSSLLVITMRDNVKQKAKDILNSLVIQYNNDAIDYKTLITENTDKFIQERINDISIDLTNVDKGVETFKTENKLTDIEREAGLNLELKSDIQNVIVNLNSQIQMVDYIRSYIDSNTEDLIPVNLGLIDGAVNDFTNNYNILILERNRIIKGSSKLNPTIVNIDAQLVTLRQSIKQSLNSLKSSLTFSLEQAKNQNYQLNTMRDIAPRQEREFQDIKRKQQIIEALYLYLLEKREENAISLGIPVPNAKIIDKANGSNSPVSPKPILVYLIAGFVGLFIPTFFISITSIIDNKVHTIEDVEKIIKAPFLGDIPKIKTKEKFIIKENDRSSIAEAYRMLRTNLNYMFSGINENSKAIFITSTIGSEGKTFVTINLAAVLSSIDKKVLVIGADLRKPKIGKHLIIESKFGLSDLLVNNKVNIPDVVISNENFNFDVVLSGPKPPNPSNLLTNIRFEELIAYGKQHYDYVIVDTPPLSLVTDTLLVSNYADLFIYVIRSNFVDKRLLNNSELNLKLKKLKNMAFLMNMTEYKKKGYGYGYGYGD